MGRKKNKSKSNIGLLAPEIIDRIVCEVRANSKYIREVESLSVLDVDISVEDFYNWRNDLDLTVLPRKTPHFESFDEMHAANLSVFLELALKNDELVIKRFEPSLFIGDSYEIKPLFNIIFGGFVPSDIYHAWCKQIISLADDTVRLSFSDNKVDPSVVQRATNAVNRWYRKTLDDVRDTIEERSAFWWSDDGVKKFIHQKDIMFDDSGKVIEKSLFVN